jgi:hypothetical protein
MNPRTNYTLYSLIFNGEDKELTVQKLNDFALTGISNKTAPKDCQYNCKNCKKQESIFIFNNRGCFSKVRQY